MPRDDVGDALGEDLAARDVVGHEERLRAHDDDVVDDHADEVEADRVVLVDGLRDRDLRADAVGAGREERLAVGVQERGVEEAGEAADAAEHLGPVRLAHGGLHELDGEVAGSGVDTGGGVRIGGGVGGGARHGRVGGGRGHLSSLPAGCLDGRRGPASPRPRPLRPLPWPRDCIGWSRPWDSPAVSTTGCSLAEQAERAGLAEQGNGRNGGTALEVAGAI